MTTETYKGHKVGFSKVENQKDSDPFQSDPNILLYNRITLRNIN